MTNDPILADLNPEQLEAVVSTEGPLLVLAGAGSGKTRVITRRIAYLIGRKEVSPGQILAVTFTNKAAGEMKRRVSILLQQDGLNVWVGTFHATCVRILRRHAQGIGLPNSFVIYDERDQLVLIRECLKELDLSEKTINPRMIASRISRAKAELLGPSEYAMGANDFLEERVAKIYRLYQEKLRRLHALDFDDLLMMTALLFEERPEVLRSYQDLWRYLMVDEYQDTNPAQYRLIHLLAKAHRNLCVVGDDDQAIYGFRGADLSNILDFERDYPGCKVIRLEQNYRSTQRILDAAGSVIAHNLGRKGKRLWTENGEGERITVYQAEDEEDEARFISEMIKTLSVVDGRSYDEVAIFYRVNAQSRALEEAFRRFLIPYVIVGGLRFYERKEIKDMLAYLRLIANPDDEASLRRIINVPPRGIGEGTLEHLLGIARTGRISLWEACSQAVEEKRLPRKPRKALEEFCRLIERFRARMEIGGETEKKTNH
ncbi:MAG: UvrD-helicase domain-containing protein, partial [candidate division NC10 bacterium]|nr:UvrD-helicase domain-containing protein [candidate division NC10 bacterium]